MKKSVDKKLKLSDFTESTLTKFVVFLRNVVRNAFSVVYVFHGAEWRALKYVTRYVIMPCAPRTFSLLHIKQTLLRQRHEGAVQRIVYTSLGQKSHKVLLN